LQLILVFCAFIVNIIISAKHTYCFSDRHLNEKFSSSICMVRLVIKIIIVHFSDPFCAEFLLIQIL